MMTKKKRNHVVPKAKKSVSKQMKKQTAAGAKNPKPGQSMGGQKRRWRRRRSVDADVSEREQRVRELRQSLDQTSHSVDDRQAGSSQHANQSEGYSKMNTEGLEHLLSAAKSGQITMIDDINDGDERSVSRRVLNEQAGGRSVRRRRRSDSEKAGSSDEDAERTYEREPRSFPVVRDLLPIKTKKGVVKRKMVVNKEEELAEDGSDQSSAEEDELPEASAPAGDQTPKTVAALFAERRARIDRAKLRIGLLSRALLETPLDKHNNLHRLLEMLSEAEPTVMVTVRKYAAASLLEVFKDLLPSYRLQQHDMTQQLRKETIATYRYENALVNGYKKYLVKLEEYTKALGSDQSSLKGLARLCLDCMCQCLVRFRDFNFASNLVSALVPFVSHQEAEVRAAVSGAIRTVFTEDRTAERTLEIVRKLSQLIKAKQYDCRRDMTDLFLSLRIRHANLDREREDEAKANKFMTYKEKLKNMSRKERKRSKKLEALERELLATKAEENKQDKVKRHSQILTVVFTVYFKILKQLPRSGLMASVLEGLARFAHMINVDFFHDLVESFHVLLASDCLSSTREVLLCVQTVFTMLSGQGEAINIDPQRFYAHCYRALNTLSLDDVSDELRLALSALDVMLIKRRKKISPQRVLSFTKRLASLAVRAPHPAAAAALTSIRSICMAHSGTSRLLDTESVASGLYRPDVDDPEYCGAGNTLLYELTALRRSYHQPVRSLAAHLLLSCPVQGEMALPAHLRTQSATEVLETYSTREMRFTPSVTPPSVLSRRPKRARSDAQYRSEWLAAQLAAAEPSAGPPQHDQLDFAAHLLIPADTPAR